MFIDRTIMARNQGSELPVKTLKNLNSMHANTVRRIGPQGRRAIKHRRMHAGEVQALARGAVTLRLLTRGPGKDRQAVGGILLHNHLAARAKCNGVAPHNVPRRVDQNLEIA